MAHVVIGGPSLVAASASMLASVPVSHSMSGASLSCCSDSKSTTSSGSASEDVDIDGGKDEDLHPTDHHLHQRRREQDIEIDLKGMEGGDVNEERGLLVFSQCRGCAGRRRWSSISNFKS